MRQPRVPAPTTRRAKYCRDQCAKAAPALRGDVLTQGSATLYLQDFYRRATWGEEGAPRYVEVMPMRRVELGGGIYALEGDVILNYGAVTGAAFSLLRTGAVESPCASHDRR